jgi:7-cyano-7-deazaguanine synthase in queuosine biosynthesis
MSNRRIHLTATYFLDYKQKEIPVFEKGLPQLKAEEAIGPNGLDSVALDLIDIGELVYLIERNLPGSQHTNRVSKISLKLGLRYPAAWTVKAVKALQEVLLFMGGANWHFEFSEDKTLDAPPLNMKEDNSIKRVALFSGGLDSLCGAATLCGKDDVRLVSFYTRQKSLQKRLAKGLDMKPPIQWGCKLEGFSGRGRNFFYRSFMFLCLAAATARSYGANRILQFENGILASGIAPSPSGRTTKHSHHCLHRLCESIFTEVLGGEWIIENPFKNKTKREAYYEMESELGKKKAKNLAKQTETCWYLYAGLKRKEGKKEIKKKNGVPCGFCVPCLIRQTALPQKAWRNLQSDSVRNHPRHGRFFREYYGMLHRIQEVRNGSRGEFYRAMGTFLQDAVKPRGGYSIDELRELFLRFADEFMSTYRLS